MRQTDPPGPRRLRFPFFKPTMSKSTIYSEQRTLRAARLSPIRRCENEDANRSDPAPSYPIGDCCPSEREPYNGSHNASLNINPSGVSTLEAKNLTHETTCYAFSATP
jgi:hypothetical protein